MYVCMYVWGIYCLLMYRKGVCVCMYVWGIYCLRLCIGRAFNRLMKDTFKEKQIEVRLYTGLVSG